MKQTLPDIKERVIASGFQSKPEAGSRPVLADIFIFKSHCSMALTFLPVANPLFVSILSKAAVNNSYNPQATKAEMVPPG